MRVTLANALNKGNKEYKLAMFCKQPRHEVEGLGHQPSCKTFGLQLVLTAEGSGNGAQKNPHQRPETLTSN